MLCFRFRSGLRRPPLLPRAAAIPRRRSRAEHSRRRRGPLESDPRLRSCARTSRREMDPPSRGKDDTPESAAAVAAGLRPSGNTSPSVPPLTSSALDLLCAQDNAVAAEKRGLSRSEYDLVAARLRRRRTIAAPVVAVEAPASVIKPSPSAARNEAVPAGDRNPDISAAAASNIISKKSDHHGSGGEPGATNSSDHHGSTGEPGATNSSGTAGGAAGEAEAAGNGGYRIGTVKSYKRISVLGEGGFGTAWKARDTRTGELVAIKCGQEAEHGAALLREAALLAACRDNPAVVGFREVIRGPGADDMNIVMDLVGLNLRELLNRRGRFTESETRGTVRQLLAGVEKMGKQGVVHGDLKPDNVLVGNRDGRLILMICDLGLAVSVSAPPCHIEGTVWYSAPEQLLVEKNCGPPVDVWALGCVMAELLTGKPLVGQDHPAMQWTQTIFMLGVPDVVTQMDNGMDASTPSELRDRVPEELLTPAGFDVLQGLIQYEPEKRLTPAEALKMPWFSEAG